MAQRVKCLPAVQETWVWSPGWEDPLEKEMATHSSTLAWNIPWTEEPGRLQSRASQGVAHDWATSLLSSKKLEDCSLWSYRVLFFKELVECNDLTVYLYLLCTYHVLTIALHVLTSHLNFTTALEVGSIVIIPILYVTQPKAGSPGGSVVKNLPANAGDSGDSGWIPGLGRSPGGGNGNPLQYSCLENPMNRGLAGSNSQGCEESDTPKQLSMHAA